MRAAARGAPRRSSAGPDQQAQDGARAGLDAGLLGLALEHPLRGLFASPESAAVFLFCNGLTLFAAERLRRGAPVRHDQLTSDAERIAHQLNPRRAAGIGTAQALALLPRLLAFGRDDGGRFAGRSLQRGRSSLRLPPRHPDHRRGRRLLKLPELLGSKGDGLRGQTLVGALCAATYGVCLCALPAALLRLTADAVRDLLHGGRRAAHSSASPWVRCLPTGLHDRHPSRYPWRP